jgi:nitroreductase
MEAIKAMLERRSVRGFKPEQISNEQLDTILEAGKYAPSGRGRQASIMVVIQDKETIAQITKMNSDIMGTGQEDPFYGAPTIIIVLADKTIPTHLYDGTLVMGNLMNCAYAVGVDSCWIHRAREEFESEQGKALLKKWGIEGDYVGIGHVALGYRNGPLPEPKPRKEGYVYRV